MKSLIIKLLIFLYVLCRSVKADLSPQKSNGSYNELKEANNFKINQDDITLIIYNQADLLGAEISLSDAARITEVSAFNLQLPTEIFAHGWMSNAYNQSSAAVRDALLKNTNSNVIVINWDTCASNIDYFISQSCVPDVGKYVGKFIETIYEIYDYSLSNYIVIGHSLGAHIAGCIGKSTNGTIPVIIGLDAAGPFYFKAVKSVRLTENDAVYVQAIHTDASGFGIGFNVGDADFWPNGGYFQPGCTQEVLCAHKRAWMYYVESLNGNGFYAKQCDSYFRYKNGKCATNSVALMGGFKVDTNASGTYYLDTNAESPFAKGDV